MFDLPVATAVMKYICRDDCDTERLKSEQEIQSMAADFSALKRQRSSQITAEQRQAMYGQLAAEMSALPAVFLRQRDCSRVPLI